MDDQAPIYGIDKGNSRTRVLKMKKKTNRNGTEIQAKIVGKYSLEREQEARAWIEDLIGEKFPLDDFAESLKDGVILCK